jgi:hypothetical protein
VGTVVEGGPLANFKSTLVRLQESIVEIQFPLQPALLRLSATLSQYFTSCSMRVYDSAGNVIEAHSRRAILNPVTRETKSRHALEVPLRNSGSSKAVSLSSARAMKHKPLGAMRVRNFGVWEPPKRSNPILL